MPQQNANQQNNRAEFCVEMQIIMIQRYPFEGGARLMPSRHLLLLRTVCLNRSASRCELVGRATLTCARASSAGLRRNPADPYSSSRVNPITLYSYINYTLISLYKKPLITRTSRKLLLVELNYITYDKNSLLI